MDKEQLIKLAEELYQEAFDANAYFLIMQKYREMQKEYLAEMKLSPAFYSVIYGALQKACFIELANYMTGQMGHIASAPCSIPVKKS